MPGRISQANSPDSQQAKERLWLHLSHGILLDSLQEGFGILKNGLGSPYDFEKSDSLDGGCFLQGLFEAIASEAKVVGCFDKGFFHCGSFFARRFPGGVANKSEMRTPKTWEMARI